MVDYDLYVTVYGGEKLHQPFRGETLELIIQQRGKTDHPNFASHRVHHSVRHPNCLTTSLLTTHIVNKNWSPIERIGVQNALILSRIQLNLAV